jgi:hypothetical protein
VAQIGCVSLLRFYQGIKKVNFLGQTVGPAQFLGKKSANDTCLANKMLQNMPFGVGGVERFTPKY